LEQHTGLRITNLPALDQLDALLLKLKYHSRHPCCEGMSSDNVLLHCERSNLGATVACFEFARFARSRCAFGCQTLQYK
jgi:hypothetical protein